MSGMRHWELHSEINLSPIVMFMRSTIFIINVLFAGYPLFAQSFSFGADLSYVNQMEDCGVVYKEMDQTVDPYQIFSDHECNLVRLRLWHTPAWCDTLNAGMRYSDIADVKKGIARARALGMKVLLDFHLSDTWADPQHQVVPAAWLGVVDNLPLLADSLGNYIRKTLLELNAEGLLPELVQIGNETNRGILLAPAVDAAGWSLDWNRNSTLFKRAIQAVRSVESTTGKSIKVALHIAGPTNAGWLMQGFWSNGVTDFDMIGLSYYWAWHKPTSIADVGNVVAQMRQLYPGKAVMLLETGCPWTLQWNDNASNVLTDVNPGYSPASPSNQKKWLVDLCQEIINKGASGMVYWEPAWQSSTCWTAWGQGSHYENATFFDFQNNLLPGGGIDFMSFPYQNLSAVSTPESVPKFKIWLDDKADVGVLQFEDPQMQTPVSLRLLNGAGAMVMNLEINSVSGAEIRFKLPELPLGVYYCMVYAGTEYWGVQKVTFGK